MTAQAPDFASRWVLGGLPYPPEGPSPFEQVLISRLQALELWVKQAHSRINLTQPFLLPPVVLGAPVTLPAGTSDIGIQLSFTSAIRAQALVVLHLAAAITAAPGVITGGIAVTAGGVTGGDQLLGPTFNLPTANAQINASTAYALSLSAATPYVIKARVNVAGGSWQLAAVGTRMWLIGMPAVYTLP